MLLTEYNKLQFKFKVHKDIEISPEEFAQSLACTRVCIESILYDHDAKVTIAGNIINIDVANVTPEELKNSIKGCFCDAAGSTYPEYQRIELISQDLPLTAALQTSSLL